MLQGAIFKKRRKLFCALGPDAFKVCVIRKQLLFLNPPQKRKQLSICSLLQIHTNGIRALFSFGSTKLRSGVLLIYEVLSKEQRNISLAIGNQV